ncbi:MAG TPA: HAD-IIB family hydrolase [Anaerolineae bacterium]
MTQRKRWLFVSDVDHTLTGDDAALAELMDALAAARDRIVLIYNSSRPCASLRETFQSKPQMLTPDFLVGAMGTEIQDGSTGEALADYSQRLNDGWQHDQIRAMMAALPFTPHPEAFQTHFKASYDVPDVNSYRQVVECLQQEEIDAKVVYSGGKNLDIIPRAAGKAAVIDYLRQLLQIPPEHVVVAGDSANDLDMFVDPYKGIVVANADPELKELLGDHIYQARQRHAAGVLEGLRYWGVL